MTSKTGGPAWAHLRPASRPLARPAGAAAAMRIRLQGHTDLLPCFLDPPNPLHFLRGGPPNSLSPRLCMVPSPFQLLHHSWARSIHLLLMGVTDRQTDSRHVDRHLCLSSRATHAVVVLPSPRFENRLHHVCIVWLGRSCHKLDGIPLGNQLLKWQYRKASSREERRLVLKAAKLVRGGEGTEQRQGSRGCWRVVGRGRSSWRKGRQGM